MGAKNKLVQQIDSLDATDRYYDRKYQDMQDRLNHFYDQIDEIEDSITQVKVRIKNIRRQSWVVTMCINICYTLIKCIINLQMLKRKSF